MSTFSKINSDLIIRYLKKQLTAEEKRYFINWLEEDSENKDFLFGLKEVYVASQWDSIIKKADTDNEWDKLYARLRPENKVPEQKYPFSRKAFMKLVGIAAALFLVFVLGNKSNYIFHRIPDNYYTIETKAGEQTSVRLADGSVVKLNSMTKLSYPAYFNSDNRVVYLSGEAVFDVKHDKKSTPFFVNVGEYVIKVLGTHFNVSAYDADSTFTTTLEVGKVEISGIKSDPSYKTVLKPGNEFVYQRTSGKYYVTDADIDYVMGWYKGKLIFKNASLDQVITRLERKFGYTFQVENEEMKRLLYTATIEKESLSDILYNISVVTPQVTYSIDEINQIVYLKLRGLKYSGK